MKEVLGGIGRGVVALAAGGTGGHLFPAQALAEELVARGFIVHLITDERVADYGKAFPAIETHIVPSTTLSLSKPWLLPERLFKLYRGVQKAKAILRGCSPRWWWALAAIPRFRRSLPRRNSASPPACMTRMR